MRILDRPTVKVETTAFHTRAGGRTSGLAGGRELSNQGHEKLSTITIDAEPVEDAFGSGTKEREAAVSGLLGTLP